MLSKDINGIIMNEDKQHKLVNGKMPGNKNCNNNHNSGEASSLQEKQAKEESFEDESTKHGEVWQETRQVVRRFLERSLSQNAKSSMTSMKPEGYYKLKEDGRLPYYQRQQSKPEQGSLVKRDSSQNKTQRPSATQKTTHDRPSYSTLPSRPSLNELTSESKKSSFQLLQEQDTVQYLSEINVRTLKRQSESEQPDDLSDNLMMCRLIDSDSIGDATFQSSDSLPSASEDGTNPMRRRKSFNKAVTRRSVISYFETKKRQRENSTEEHKVSTEVHRRSSVTDPVPTKSPEIAHKTSLHTRKSSITEGLVSCHSRSDPCRDEDARQSVEKKTSFRDRMKRIIAGTSNKRKIKYKKSFEQRQSVEDESYQADDQPQSWAACTRQSRTSEHEFGRVEERKTHSAYVTSPPSSSRDTSGQTSSKHKTPSPYDERSPSPPKNKLHTPKLLRSFSQKKYSPKPTHRVIHHSGSSSSLSYNTVAPVGGDLERNKSGSLPLSVRYDTKIEQRRFSVDIANQPSKSHEKHSHKKRSPSPQGSPARPQNLDLGHKKGKSGKIKRFFRFWRRRHLSESSSGSSLSQSLPSLPSAVEQEEQFDGEILDLSNAGEMKPRLQGQTSEEEQEHKPYHHRGSLSFSSGDLDGLSLPEKQKIYDEIAETLSRLSFKYNRHIQSRSTTPGSKITTPESSLTTHEYRQYARGPPSRQTSAPSTRGPVHPQGKSFRKYKDEKQPALAAYMNIRDQTTSSRPGESHAAKMASKMPRPLIPRRHTHHAQTGSLDSPYSQNKLPKRLASDVLSQPPPASDASPAEPAAAGDVIDGAPPVESESSAGEKSRTSREDSEQTRSLVRYSHARTSSITADEESYCRLNHHHNTIASTHHGSAVDFPSIYPTSTPPGDEGTRQSRPSTSSSKLADEFEDHGLPISTEPYNEEKLVNMLVQALCQKGDEYTRSVDMPNGDLCEPVFRSTMISYMRGATYSGFQHIAKRFCQNVKQLVETSPSRHPEIFPVVMVFNMTQLMIDLASSDTTRQAVNHILNLSTQLVTDIVQGTGNTWGTVLMQLHDTEEELSAVESPEESPRRTTNTDDELD